MPRPHRPEFRRRAVELARERAKPVSEIARDLGISDSCLRNWMVKADIDDGREAPNPDERTELVELRRKLRVSEMENESFTGPRPTSPGRTSSQNDLHLHRPTLRGPAGQQRAAGS